MVGVGGERGVRGEGRKKGRKEGGKNDQGNEMMGGKEAELVQKPHQARHESAGRAGQMFFFFK